MATAALLIFILSNLTIVAGYVYVGLRIMPYADVNMKRTRYGGIAFFLTCAYTHTHLALHAVTSGGLSLDDMISWHMLIVHVVQALSVWIFVTGLYIEFVKWGPWGQHWKKMLEDEADGRVN